MSNGREYKNRRRPHPNPLPEGEGTDHVIHAPMNEANDTKAADANASIHHQQPSATDWQVSLQTELSARQTQHQLRSLRSLQSHGPRITFQGRELVNLASNDYLGLSQHPHLRDKVIEAATQWGVGSGASRLVGGTLAIHTQLEQRFAQFKHAQAALLCPTGYMANLAVLTSLVGEGDLICIDKLTHASLIDAAQNSRAVVRVYPHGDLQKLDRLLARWCAQPRSNSDVVGKDATDSPVISKTLTPTRNRTNRASRGRALVVTDSVFSMDGDVADLPGLCDIAQKYGAITVVDEAHGTGVLGETGAGLCEWQGVAQRVDVVISTASKALGGLGGIITAAQLVIDTLVNQARSFIYTTSVPPTQVAAIDAALDVVRDEPWRRKRVLSLARWVHDEMTQLTGQRDLGFHLLQAAGGRDAETVVTPIVPLVTGSAERALGLSERLMQRGFFAPAIRPPTVAPNASRVRLSLRADLADEDVQRLLAVLAEGG